MKDCRQGSVATRDQAVKLVLDHAPLPRHTSLKPFEAVNLAIRNTVAAPLDVPEFRRSRRDGYAVNSADINPTHSEPKSFILDDPLYAESFSPANLQHGHAVRILTGAKLPDNADSVIPDEDLPRNALTEKSLTISGDITPGSFVRPRGDDLKQGHILIRAGQIVTPPAAAAMTEAKIDLIDVFLSPRARIVCLGSELHDPRKNRNGIDSIPADNLVLLDGLLRENGVWEMKASVCPDSLEAVRKELLGELEAELIITTGGSGPSEKDFALEAARDSGFEILFNSIDMRPGRSAFAGVRNNQILFGLPGPPPAVQTCFHTLIMPALLALRGKSPAPKDSVTMELGQDLTLSPGPEMFLGCRMETCDAKIIAMPIPKTETPMIQSMVDSHGLIICPAGVGSLSKGDAVEVIIFPPCPVF